MPKLDLAKIPVRSGSGYPEKFRAPCMPRTAQALGAAAGLTQFGANLVRLPPGAWSSQRHWHTDEDEFVYVIAGELTLVTNDGPVIMRPGDCAAFKAGDENGHHLKNESTQDGVFLVIGGRSDRDVAYYPDIDLHCQAGRYSAPAVFTRKDGTRY